MDTNQINNYKIAANNSVGKSSAKSASSLSVDQFLSLLAAQLSNQDVMNPTQDTEFVSQMAQFTTLQAMENLTTYASYQYGSSLIGKKVSVAMYDKSGKYIQDVGLVSRADFSSSGDTNLIVNGRSYGVNNIMEVVSDSSYQSYQYATSLVGKAVQVSGYDKDGKVVESSGIVSACNFTSGEAMIVVDGQNYTLSAVRKVLTEVPKDDDKDKTDPEDKTGTETKTDVISGTNPSEGG